MRLRTVGVTRRERARLLPGDALVGECVMQATHAVTVAAAPGDVMPALPGATDALVADLQEPHHLVQAVPTTSGAVRASWAFVRETNGWRTRVIARARFGELRMTLPRGR